MGMLNRKDYAKHKLGDKVKPKTHTGAGLTKQEFAKESDINYIMERYRTTGELPASLTGQVQGIFADCTAVGDFATVMRRVQDAEEAFAALPAPVRQRFGGDAAALVEFLADSNNRDEAEKLGLVPKKEVTPVPQDPAAPPSPPAKP